MEKKEINYFVNGVMGIFALLCGLSGLALYFKSGQPFPRGFFLPLKMVHIWAGFVVIGLIVLHLVLHIRWVASLTKKIFMQRLKAAVFVAMVMISLLSVVPVVQYSKNAAPGVHANQQQIEGNVTGASSASQSKEAKNEN